MAKDQGQLILQRLAEARAENPDLKSYFDFHQAVLRSLDETKAGIKGTLELVDQEALHARLLQGSPVLSFSQLPIEPGPFAELAVLLARAMANYEPELAGQRLPTDAHEWVSLAERRFIEGQAISEARDETATINVAQLTADFALRPYLVWAAEQVLPYIDQQRWKRSYCPICAGPPDLALLTEESGARRLVCSRCNTQWLYQRLGCPFCATSDHTKISYYPSDDGKYRLYVCKECRRYLKTVDMRQVRHPVFVEAERIATVDLDFAARTEGFH